MITFTMTSTQTFFLPLMITSKGTVMPLNQLRDPSCSRYWSLFTSSEQQAILDHPIHDASIELDLLGILLRDFIASLPSPVTDPDFSLQLLYTTARVTSVMGSLYLYQRQRHQQHPRYEKMLKDAFREVRISQGIYRQMHEAGFAIPADIPNVALLRPSPLIPSDSLGSHVLSSLSP